MSAREPVLFSKARYELRQALSVRGREEGAVLIPLTIALSQMRKVLPEEWEKHGSGAGFEK